MWGVNNKNTHTNIQQRKASQQPPKAIVCECWRRAICAGHGLGVCLCTGGVGGHGFYPAADGWLTGRMSVCSVGLEHTHTHTHTHSRTKRTGRRVVHNKRMAKLNGGSHRNELAVNGGRKGRDFVSSCLSQSVGNGKQQRSRRRAIRRMIGGGVDLLGVPVSSQHCV